MKVNELIISVRATHMQYNIMYMYISTHASEVSTLIAFEAAALFFCSSLLPFINEF